MSSRPASSRRLWLLGLLIWIVLGLMSAAQNAAWRAYVDRPIPWGSLLANSLGDWLTCGMFTPAFYWMVRRFPIRGEQWWTRLPVHLTGSIAFTLLKVSVWTPLSNLLNSAETRTFSQMLFGGFYADMLAYWAAVGVIHAIEYYRAQARLDGALRAAELENLRAQLHPHFLFNTLQSISTLIHRDPAAADRMLTDLADLLRLSLRHTAAQEVPLREELGFLGRYLDIMRVRFGDRLGIAVDAGDDVLDAMVPSLVLQPLVENAIRHGMADRADKGHVAIRALRVGGAVLLEVSDDGPGLRGRSPGEGNGIGLANTRERLARLYGPAGRIETASAAGRGGGLTVRLTIPIRHA